MAEHSPTVYLDYAATTPLDPRVRDFMRALLEDSGLAGNASSSHAEGRRSLARVERAARQLATLLNTDPDRLIWTSGATESNNLAISGTAIFWKDSGRHLISMRTEHKAVTDTLQALERDGFEVTWLAPDSNGVLNLADLEAAIRPDTQLVSIMHVNNETGATQDIAAIGQLCREKGVRLHVDAAQSCGKLPIDLSTLPVDLLSVTAHKCYGPVGVGALYVADRRGTQIAPLLFGGGQQRRLRPGTLPVHQIAAFGAAAELATSEWRADLQHARACREQLWSGIQDLPDIVVNGSLDNAWPGILNVSAGGVEGESLLLALEPLCLATGSACNSQNTEPSYVLRALGRSDALAQSAIRFSFGRMTTENDIRVAIDRYRQAVLRLRQLAPVRAA